MTGLDIAIVMAVVGAGGLGAVLGYKVGWAAAWHRALEIIRQEGEE